MTHPAAPDARTIFPSLALAECGRQTLSDRQRADYAYFTQALPGYPDPADMRYHAEAMNEMSPTGIRFYLDFLLSALEADPWGHDMVFHHLETWLETLKNDAANTTGDAQDRLARIAARRFG